MKKLFSDVATQIEILKSKNLQINDEQRALDILLRHNYYVIINGYRAPFLDNSSDRGNSKYINGSSFEEIYSLYIFDRNIRISFLKYMLIVEQNFKSAISYEFSKIYGHENYLQFENFDCENEKNIRDIFYMMGTMHNSLSKAIGKNEYITYNIEKYNNVPFWILANVVTLGGIINFYKLMKVDEKKFIAKKYFKIKYDELEDFMYIISFYRNISAHDERMYDVKYKGSLPNNEVSDYFNKMYGKNIDTKKVFSLFISLYTLLSKNDAIDMITDLEKSFSTLSKQLHSIKIDKIYDFMGFEKNFGEIKNIWDKY